jgi:hypothetical protein
MLMVCAPVTDQARLVVWSLVILAGVAVKLVIVGNGTPGGGGVTIASGSELEPPHPDAKTTVTRSAAALTDLVLRVFIRVGV